MNNGLKAALRAGALGAVMLSFPGCFGTLQPAATTFRGLRNPVLLGPVDHIGGGQPLTAKKIAEMEGQSEAIYTHSEYENGTGYVMTVDRERRDESEVQMAAHRALSVVGSSGDIRITTLRTWARGWPTGTKNTVYVQGDVVDVGGAK